MTLHKEGFKTILITFLFFIIINLILWIFVGNNHLIFLTSSICLVLLIFIIQFFRYPNRILGSVSEHDIISPADGTVVVIEQVEETEYFKDKRIQVSIFMSPLNVHVNRYPIAGVVKYVKYHPGKYLFAWHPKSSLENERNTVVIEDSNKNVILVRQIAGALARRIICYSNENEEVLKGDDMGFIKFGSRVDVFLPLTTKINVKLNQKVKGKVNVIAKF